MPIKKDIFGPRIIIICIYSIRELVYATGMTTSSVIDSALARIRADAMDWGMQKFFSSINIEDPVWSKDGVFTDQLSDSVDRAREEYRDAFDVAIGELLFPVEEIFAVSTTGPIEEFTMRIARSNGIIEAWKLTLTEEPCVVWTSRRLL